MRWPRPSAAAAPVVLFIDLDRFKEVNDTLGHDAGDRLLIAVAARLREAVGRRHVARLGGDEFAVLCDELVGRRGRPGGRRHRVRRCLRPFHLDGRDVFVAASVGIALGTAPDAPRLLRTPTPRCTGPRAAAATATSSSTSGCASRPQARLAATPGCGRRWTPRVRGLLPADRRPGPPGNPVGVEALARWRHPTRGLLPPSAFIDLAEETGLIVPLGTQILRTALRRCRRGAPTAARRPLRVAVNLSARQLTNPDLVPRSSRPWPTPGCRRPGSRWRSPRACC